MPARHRSCWAAFRLHASWFAPALWQLSCRERTRALPILAMRAASIGRVSRHVAYSLHRTRTDDFAALHPRPLHAFEQGGKLRGRQLQHAILDWRPAELAG